ncbi:MAG: hypothetical protein U9N83_09955 [Thermodesulfobacteriota bacterium]|nr:hypothetical protein [Thermodesulfobacteriota bacterium]
MSLNESPDCQIENVIHADEIEVIAQVATYLKDEQMQYFSRNHDCLTTDLHSTKARLGINQEKLSAFELKGNKISYETRFWFYIPEYAENAITFVKKKLGIGHYKPQIFLGEFYNPLQDLLTHMTSEGMVDPSVFKNCYFIKHGAEIFETLCRHFGSEDKMVLEVSVNENQLSDATQK